MRKACVTTVLRCTVNRLAPGPEIVRFLLINNSSLVRVIVVRPAAKLIVSLEAAAAMACRSVQPAPGHVPPASAVLFTVMVAAGAAAAARASNAIKAAQVLP